MADTVAKNKEYFSELAKEYDERHGKSLAMIRDYVRSHKNFIASNWANKDDTSSSKKVRLLDYACGTGMVTRALGEWITSATGIDVTENMVDIYNSRADSLKVPMKGYQGNLCSPSDPNPPAFSDPALFHNFDLAGVGLGFHHFEDPTFAAKQLASRLRPGGTLFIIDFLPHDSPSHDSAAKSSVTQHGFSREQIETIFQDAGCGGDFDVSVMGDVVFDNLHGNPEKKMERKIFLARGTKA